MGNTKLRRIQAVLKVQNPWWDDPATRIALAFPHRRAEFQWLEQRTASEARRAYVVLGPRTVGKSVLLKQWIDAQLDRGFPHRNLVYADLDEPLFPSRMTLEELRSATTQMEVGSAGTKYFVIDEVSRSSGQWSQYLRRFIQTTKDGYLVTDSASAVLLGAGVETGQGRFDEIRLGGMSFRDFYALYFSRGFEGTDQDLDPLKAARACDEYLLRGGFPMHVHSPVASEARRLLRQDIAEKAIINDLGRLTRGDVGFLSDLFVALAERSGDIFVAQKWAEDLQTGVTRQRLARALRDFEMTALVARLARHGKSRRTQLGQHPKVYLTDPGLVSAFSKLGDPMNDPDTLGRLVECAVFTHLERRARFESATLSFWRKDDDLECDFVIGKEGSNSLVECTASAQMDTRKAQRLTKVSKQIKGVKRVICVSRCASGTRHTHTGITIEEMPLWSFLDRLSRQSLEGLLS